jgi:hypothetical protein
MTTQGYAKGWEWVPKKIYSYSTIQPVIVETTHYMIVLHQGEDSMNMKISVEKWLNFLERVLLKLLTSNSLPFTQDPGRVMLRKTFEYKGQTYFLDICFVSPPPSNGIVFEHLWSAFEAYIVGGWKSWKVWVWSFRK